MRYAVTGPLPVLPRGRRARTGLLHPVRLTMVRGSYKLSCNTFCNTFEVGQRHPITIGQKRISANVYKGELTVECKRMESPEMAIFPIISPVRLPFRHTG